MSTKSVPFARPESHVTHICSELVDIINAQGDTASKCTGNLEEIGEGIHVGGGHSQQTVTE